MITGDLEVALRDPTGEDELLVLESRRPPAAVLVELVERVAISTGSGGIDWSEVPASSLGRLALQLRRVWIGERIVTDGRCTNPSCRDRYDVTIGIDEYLAHHRTRRPRNVTGPDEKGWYGLSRVAVRFRLPSVADLLAALDDTAPAQALRTRCVEPFDAPAGSLRAVERAMAALSPGADGQVGGSCPGCGAEVRLAFDPLTYTLAELSDRFASLYADVHVLASSYGWSEQSILALPHGRRRRYTSMLAGEREPA